MSPGRPPLPSARLRDGWPAAACPALGAAWVFHACVANSVHYLDGRRQSLVVGSQADEAETSESPSGQPPGVISD